MNRPSPRRGEVWLTDLDPPFDHEQAGQRPVLVVSVDLFNSSAADMLVAVPLTTKLRQVVWHVAIQPPEGGTTRPSQIKCDHIRAISPRRLIRRMGVISAATLAEVEDRLRVLLDL
jgi:mRNA interferase MazF